MLLAVLAAGGVFAWRSTSGGTATAPAVASKKTARQPSATSPASADTDSDQPAAAEPEKPAKKPRRTRPATPESDPPATANADALDLRTAIGGHKQKFPVNLPALITPEAPWSFEGKALVYAPEGNNGHGRLDIPVIPPREYVLTAIISRRDEGEIDFGLPSGATRFAVAIDGWHGTTSAHLIDGVDGSKNAAAHQGWVTTIGQEHQFTIVVRSAGVAIYCDGQPCFKFHGDPQRLGGVDTLVDDGPFDSSAAKALLLGGLAGSYTIRDMQFRSLSGEQPEFISPSGTQLATATPAAKPDDSQPPTNNDGNPVPTQPAAPQPPTTPAAQPPAVMVAPDSPPQPMNTPRAPLAPPAGNEPNRPLRVLQERSDHVSYVAVSPDGHWAAWGGFNNVNSIADLRKNTMVDPPQVRENVTDVAFLPDGVNLLGVTYSGAFAWNIETHELRQVGAFTRVAGSSMQIVASSGTAYATAENHSASVFATNNAALLFRPDEIAGDVYRMGLSPRGRFMLTSGFIRIQQNNMQAQTGFSKVYDVKARRELPCDRQVASDSSCIAALTDDGKMVVTGSFPGHSFALLDLVGNTVLKTVNLEGNERISSLAISTDGKRVLAGLSAGSLNVYNLPGGELATTLIGHHGSVFHVAISADGRLAISADSTGGVLLWRLAATRRFNTRTAAVAKLPSDDAQKQATKTLREAFAAELGKARKAADKVALAEKMLLEAENSHSEPEKYALACEARDLARGGGDPAMYLQAMDLLYQTFDIDLAEQMPADVEALAKNPLTNPVREQFAEGLLPVTERLAGDEKYDAANRVLAVAASVARKIKNPPLNKTIAARQADLKEQTAQAATIKTAAATLRDHPDDPAANLALGKFHCLLKNDWEAGLPYLAKASDATLQSAANLEIAKPVTSADQSQLGDAWYAIAESAGKRDKAKYFAHAVTWYRLAVPGLDGLASVKVKKRIAELTESEEK